MCGSTVSSSSTLASTLLYVSSRSAIVHTPFTSLSNWPPGVRSPAIDSSWSRSAGAFASWPSVSSTVRDGAPDRSTTSDSSVRIDSFLKSYGVFGAPASGVISTTDSRSAPRRRATRSTSAAGLRGYTRTWSVIVARRPSCLRWSSDVTVTRSIRVTGSYPAGVSAAFPCTTAGRFPRCSTCGSARDVRHRFSSYVACTPWPSPECPRAPHSERFQPRNATSCPLFSSSQLSCIRIIDGAPIFFSCSFTDFAAALKWSLWLFPRPSTAYGTDFSSGRRPALSSFQNSSAFDGNSPVPYVEQMITTASGVDPPRSSDTPSSIEQTVGVMPWLSAYVLSMRAYVSAVPVWLPYRIVRRFALPPSTARSAAASSARATSGDTGTALRASALSARHAPMLPILCCSSTLISRVHSAPPGFTEFRYCTSGTPADRKYFTERRICCF